MAALVDTVSLPARQPFGVVGESRLRLLESMKNHQNNIKRPSPSKRSLDDLISDAENIAPPPEDDNCKRQKTSVDDDDVAASKYILSTTTVTPPQPAPPKTSDLDLPSAMNSPSPKLAANASPSERSPLTAPAGRSPPRRKSLKTFAAARSPVPSPKRFGPSRLLAQHNAPRVPFSVTTALNGTFSYSSTIPKQSSTLNPASNRRQKPKPLRSVSKRSGAWDFEIHADTCEEEITNLMQHSTSILDISDDGERERRRSAKGKENIPPASEGQSMEQEYTGPVTRSRANASKNVTMTDDQSRVVLGELNPSDFATEEQLQSDSEHDSSDAGNNENDAQEEFESILAVIPEKDESEKIGEQVSQTLEHETASKSRPLTRRLTRAAAAAAAAAAEHQHSKGEGEEAAEEESTKPSFKIFDESIAERAASN